MQYKRTPVQRKIYLQKLKSRAEDWQRRRIVAAGRTVCEGMTFGEAHRLLHDIYQKKRNERGELEAYIMSFGVRIKHLILKTDQEILTLAEEYRAKYGTPVIEPVNKWK